MSDLKPVKVSGELFWTKWMNNFNTAFNPDNDKYECTLGNISDDDAAKLTSLGIKVKHKDAMGNFIVGKSKYAFKPTDDTLKEVPIEALGNGSKCVAIVSSYTHRMSAKHGNAPSIKTLMVTEVKTYVPEPETDDEAL
jgi:dihydroxyacetone kinase